MKTLVDADACPVRGIIIRVAAEEGIRVILFVDTSHLIVDEAEIVTVDTAANSVDITLINATEKGDIIVTQDYGLASLALSKRAYALNHNGFIFLEKNIDRLLIERHMNRNNIHRTKGMRKRTRADDEKFERAYRYLISLAKKG